MKHWILLAGAIITFSFFVLLAYLWSARASMPYNEMARYHDGHVVWHEQGAGVYGLMALFSLLMTILLAFLYVRAKAK